MLFVVLGHSLPFDPPKNQKMKNFEKKKNAWRYYHFALVYYIQMTIMMYFLPFYDIIILH